MMIRTAFAIALLSAFVPPSMAADTVAREPIERVVEKLGAKDFTVREAAAKELSSRGAEALPGMRKAQPHPDPEVKQRLTKLIAETERVVLLSPKVVTLHADQKSVQEVMADLAKQTDYKLQIQSNNRLPVTIHADKQPFWQVLDDVSRQAGLNLQPHHDGSGGLMFYQQNSHTPYVFYEGAFRLAAVSFHYSKTMPLANLPQQQPVGRQRTEGLTFAFNIISEPKSPLMSLGQPKLITAIDDQENSLLLAQGRNMYESHFSGYYGYRNQLMQSQVQLQGHGGARFLKLLKGTIPVTILADQKAELVIDNILAVKNQKFEGGQVIFDIQEVKEGPGKTVQITSTVRRNTGDNSNYDYSWTNSLHQRVELTDENGKKFSSQGFNWDNGTPASVTGTFMFGDPGDGKIGKPTKLTYYGWVTAQHVIDFEFRDLPLP